MNKLNNRKETVVYSDSPMHLSKQTFALNALFKSRMDL